MEVQVRRDGGSGCSAPEGPGRGEQSPQAHVRRAVLGEHGVEGCHRKKAVDPAHKRPLMSWLMDAHDRSEEHTSELQSLMRISYAVFCLKKKKKNDALITRSAN